MTREQLKNSVLNKMDARFKSVRMAAERAIEQYYFDHNNTDNVIVYDGILTDDDRSVKIVERLVQYFKDDDWTVSYNTSVFHFDDGTLGTSDKSFKKHVVTVSRSI